MSLPPRWFVITLTVLMFSESFNIAKRHVLWTTTSLALIYIIYMRSAGVLVISPDWLSNITRTPKGIEIILILGRLCLNIEKLRRT